MFHDACFSFSAASWRVAGVCRREVFKYRIFGRKFNYIPSTMFLVYLLAGNQNPCHRLLPPSPCAFAASQHLPWRSQCDTCSRQVTLVFDTCSRQPSHSTRCSSRPTARREKSRNAAMSPAIVFVPHDMHDIAHKQIVSQICFVAE